MGLALVTGASSGLGEEFCWQLAEAGHDLIVVARTEKALQSLARSINGATGVQVEIMTADLTNGEDRKRIMARLIDPQSRAVGLLVNNAGAGLGRAFIDNDLAVETAGRQLMVDAVMDLSQAAISRMRTEGRGAILNVSSVASETGAGTYSAHKAWVKAFTEGLAMELAGTNITATCVMPGPTRTNFFDNAGVDFHQMPHWAWSTSEQVARSALLAVRRGQVLVTPHWVMKSLMVAMRVAPRWVTRRVVKNTPHM